MDIDSVHNTRPRPVESALRHTQTDPEAIRRAATFQAIEWAKAVAAKAKPVDSPQEPEKKQTTKRTEKEIGAAEGLVMLAQRALEFMEGTAGSQG